MLLIYLTALLSLSHAAPVRIWCVDYITLKPQSAAIVVRSGEGQMWKLSANATGYAQLDAPVGGKLTVEASSSHHHATMSPIVTVPSTGLVDEQNEIVMQMVSHLVYDFFWTVTPDRGHKKNHSACQVVVTVCDKNKTIRSSPQGLPGVQLHVDPPNYSTLFYFGTMLGNKTDPFPNDRHSTSWDGGVLIENVPVGETVYTITATKPGLSFTQTVVQCSSPGLFINGAPNQGPRVI